MSNRIAISNSVRKSFNELRNIAENFDLSDVINRYIQDYSVSSDIAELHAREFLRYLVVSQSFPSLEFPMAGPADDFWHVFLIFTRKYLLICEKLSGKFLHHEPVTNYSLSEKQDALSQYNFFLTAYRDLYVMEPPQMVWPRFSSDFQSHSAEFKIL
jgi:hypothetical protein